MIFAAYMCGMATLILMFVGFVAVGMTHDAIRTEGDVARFVIVTVVAFLLSIWAMDLIWNDAYRWFLKW